MDEVVDVVLVMTGEISVPNADWRLVTAKGSAGGCGLELCGCCTCPKRLSAEVSMGEG